MNIEINSAQASTKIKISDKNLKNTTVSPAID